MYSRATSTIESDEDDFDHGAFVGRHLQISDRHEIDQHYDIHRNEYGTTSSSSTTPTWSSRPHHSWQSTWCSQHEIRGIRDTITDRSSTNASILRIVAEAVRDPTQRSFPDQTMFMSIFNDMCVNNVQQVADFSKGIQAR